MIERMSIGTAPWGEDCAMLGRHDYRARAERETAAYLSQLRRMFGPEPPGCALVARWCEHDFGSYLDCEAWFDPHYTLAVKYAVDCESKQPELWDSEAREELEIKDADATDANI